MPGDRIVEVLFQPARRRFRPVPSCSCRLFTMRRAAAREFFDIHWRAESKKYEQVSDKWSSSAISSTPERDSTTWTRDSCPTADLGSAGTYPGKRAAAGLRERGYTGGYTMLKALVAALASSGAGLLGIAVLFGRQQRKKWIECDVPHISSTARELSYVR
jgi:hypothetical protein